MTANIFGNLLVWGLISGTLYPISLNTLKYTTQKVLEV